ncbi:MAG: protein-S-isoprenylcysteine O-methyltransferase [Pseudomonadota bacterium]
MLFKSIFTFVAIGLIACIAWRWQINGWPSLLWVIMVCLMAMIRAPIAAKTNANEITQKTAVSVERGLLLLVSFGGTILPALHLTTGAFEFANYQLPNWAAYWGAGLLILGLWLFRRSHADLGQNWSVTTELRDGQKLITSGVYKTIRHPMYSAIWILFLTQPLFVHNWIAGVSGPIAFAAMYFIRVPYEEKMMRERFGEAYDDYCLRSGRVLPRV